MNKNNTLSITGFHPGFFNWGVQHQCHCAATHVTRGGVGCRGVGGLCQYTDLIGPVGSRGLPIMHCAPNICYRKSESMSEIVGFVTYFRGGSRIFHLRSARGTLHSQKMLNFSNQFPAFWWDLKDFYLTLILLMLLLSMAIK